MQKNPSTLIARAKFIQDEINKRPANEKIESKVIELADKLFLSKETIWKDYSKPITPTRPNNRF